MKIYIFYTLFLLLHSFVQLSALQIGASGTIKPKDGLIYLGANLTGIIEKIYVVKNETVKKDSLLLITSENKIAKIQLEIEKENFENFKTDHELKKTQLSLTLEKAIAAEEEAAKHFDRYRHLKKESQTESEGVRRKYGHDYAKNAVEQAHNALNLFDIEYPQNLKTLKNKVDIAQANLERTHIKAPIDGIILDIPKSKGEIAGSSSAIVMGNLNAIVVDAEFYETDLVKIKNGMVAKISHRAFQTPINGKVIFISKMVSKLDKTGIVTILVDDPKPLANFLGMEVDVEIDV